MRSAFILAAIATATQAWGASCGSIPDGIYSLRVNSSQPSEVIVASRTAILAPDTVRAFRLVDTMARIDLMSAISCSLDEGVVAVVLPAENFQSQTVSLLRSALSPTAPAGSIARVAAPRFLYSASFATRGRHAGEVGVVVPARLGRLDAELSAQAGTYSQEFALSFRDEDRRTTARLGSGITVPAGGVAAPVRFVGAQVGTMRNAAIDAGYVQNTFSGTAALPSTVEIFIAGQRYMSSQIGAGRYTVEGLPSMAGDVRIVVRDELGREQVITGVLPGGGEILPAGRVEFSAATGVLRRGYSTLAHGPLMTSAVISRGFAISNLPLTGTLGADESDGTARVYANLVAASRIGTTTFQAARSAGQRDATALRLAHRASGRIAGGMASISATMQRVRGEFFPLGALLPLRNQSTISASYSLAGWSVSAAMARDGFFGSRTILSLSRGRFGISATQASSQKTTVTASYILPLLSDGIVGIATAGERSALQLQRPRDGLNGLSWLAQANHEHFGTRGYGRLSYGTNEYEATAEVVAERASTARFGLTGGFALFPEGFRAIRRIDANQELMDIDAQGPDIELRVGGIRVGKTGSDGRIIAGVYPGREIDIRRIGDAEQVELQGDTYRVTPDSNGKATILTWPSRPPAVLVELPAEVKPLAPGSEVMAGGYVHVAGRSGIWVENLKPGEYTAKTSNNEFCVRFSIPEKARASQSVPGQKCPN